MTLKTARELKPGDLVTPKITDPSAEEPDYVERGYLHYKPVNPGTVLIFRKIIPKVRIVNLYPWQDNYDVKLLCKTANGRNAWLGIKNAKRVAKKG